MSALSNLLRTSKSSSPSSSAGVSTAPSPAMDEAIFDKIECLRAENRALKQKLGSKAEALVILSRDLDKARAEADDFRKITSLLQQSKASQSFPSNASLSLDQQEDCSLAPFNSASVRQRSALKKLDELKAENARLLAERQRLRATLTEKEEDLGHIRTTMKIMQEKVRSRDSDPRESSATNSAGSSSSNTEALVRRMETLQMRYINLRKDLQSLLDQREDLVQERDAYKCKLRRLNSAMAALLKADAHALVDVDWLLAENRHLQEALEQAHDEKRLANAMGKRYKSALEKTRADTVARAKAKAKAKAGGNRATQEAEELEERQRVSSEILRLSSETSFPMPANMDLNSVDSLKELCMALLETLSERMTQLQQQRAANRHIAEKLKQLEQRIMQEHGELGDLILRPSLYLSKGFADANGRNEGEEEELYSSAETALKLMSRQSSCFSTETGDDEDEQPQPREGTSSASASIVINPPPDIIAEGVARHKMKSEVAASENAASDEVIQLPAHLQALVDKAMLEITAQEEEEEQSD